MRKRLLIIGAFFVFIAFLLGSLFYFGVLHFNNPSEKDYPVRGVDLSRYQGDVDWKTLEDQGIRFAYIKATEGSSYVDPKFSENWAGVKQTDLAYGAYHFFSFDSSGQKQAEHYIASVPDGGMMPPAIDLEFYGDKEKNPPDQRKVQTELQVMLEALQQYYGQRPVIYATEKSYQMYLSGAFSDTDIWIRNVVSKPKMDDGRSWTFWQYRNRARMKGYRNGTPYIDLNVFCGSEQEFEKWLESAKNIFSKPRE